MTKPRHTEDEVLALLHNPETEVTLSDHLTEARANRLTKPRKPTCPKCGLLALVYIEKYDAYACLDDDMWLEPQCSDPTCVYCPGRPERPT